MDFLQVKDGRIVNAKGKEVKLRGVNLGGWLMMEGYILGGRNIAESQFKKDIAANCGQKSLLRFEESYRHNFITAADFINIKKLRATVVRLPFHYHIVTTGKWSFLDKAIAWAKKNNIYVILDLHAAPGAQNGDWHSDSAGKARLWQEKKYREELYAIWRQLAERYKNEPAIAGYDVLNEAVGKNTRIIKEVYVRLTQAIRATGDRHIIFIEGNTWSQEFEFLGRPWDDNLAFSFHYYLPGDFTFNCTRNLRYPGKINGELWNRKKMENILQRYVKLQKKYRIPIYCGEFGVNLRCPDCATELAWVRDVLEIFKKYGIHYTYWTYKAVAGGYFPDGIYQYLDNPPWINRWSQTTGVETYCQVWSKKSKAMGESWKTKHFVKSAGLSQLLARYNKD
ncbi:MAG: glycoside hydrolase family 5 protein [bacterium]|nr:glycoside hydrolase family 5 protein [bacterium]MDD5353789.1 glycoside hydrolase family 5 protein [bacterium]MDD5757035.1 glycoside hydrolase family 5 protein [bacterium]